MVFHWSFCDSKSPQVSRPFSVFWPFSKCCSWIVSSRLPIFKSSRLCTNPLVNVPSTPITIGITVTFMFHSFFSCLAKSRYLSLFSLSFSFTLWSTGTTRSSIRQVLFFFCWLSQDQVVRLRLGDQFVSQNPREVWASHFPGRTLGCPYICWYGQILVSCTIPNGSPCPTRRV